MIGESFIRHPKEFLSSLGKSRDALGRSRMASAYLGARFEPATCSDGTSYRPQATAVR